MSKKQKNRKEKNEITEVSEEYLIKLDEDKLPSIISERMALLEETNKAYEIAKEKEKVSKEKVDKALKKADQLIANASETGKNRAEKKKFLGKEWTSKKDEIYAIKQNLQEMIDCNIDGAQAQKELAEVQSALAESQTSLLKVQETQMIYQSQIADATKFLYGLCAYNYGAAQSVLINLEAVFEGASREKLGEMAQQQLLLAMDQIKNQESIILKVRENKDLINTLEIDMGSQKRQIDRNAKTSEELEKRIRALKRDEEELFAQFKLKSIILQENIKHDEMQDRLHEEHTRKDLEHDKQIAERIAHDEQQDRLHEEHTRKDLEHDKQIAERIAHDEQQDRLHEEHTRKDLEHDKQIAERIAHDEQQDRLHEEHAKKDLEHERQITERVAHDEKQDKEIKEQAQRGMQRDKKILERVVHDEQQDVEIKKQAQKALQHDKQIADIVVHDEEQDKLIASQAKKYDLHNELLLNQKEVNHEYGKKIVELQVLIERLENETNEKTRELEELSDRIIKMNGEKADKKMSICSLVIGIMSLVGVIIQTIV